MPFFVAVNPETLKITHMYEYTEADPSRDPTATHIEVIPPMDYRAVIVNKDLTLSPDIDKLSEMYKHEYRVIRSQRDDFLYKSDWTCSVTDAPLTPEKKAEWATYRQQLRDLTIEGSCPLDFVWPQPPS